jgi:hypothetical protein
MEPKKPVSTDGALVTVSAVGIVVGWRIDPASYLVSPAGTRIARITEDTLYLFDKKIGTGLPFTREHWAALFASLKIDG